MWREREECLIYAEDTECKNANMQIFQSAECEHFAYYDHIISSNRCSFVRLESNSIALCLYKGLPSRQEYCCISSSPVYFFWIAWIICQPDS